jgi:hypothetical protein
VEIPEWFIWLQSSITVVLVPICGAALRVLWQMRQELTVLNTKMDLTHGLQSEVDQLQSDLNIMRAEGCSYARNAIPSLQKHVQTLYKQLRGVEQRMDRLHGIKGAIKERDSDSDSREMEIP